jgi:hypothetical protein
VKLALVVVPSVSTLFESVGEVLTAAVLYTTPLADNADPVMPCPPVLADVFVIDDAAVVVVISGIPKAIPSLPMAKYEFVPLVGSVWLKPDAAAVNGFEPLTLAAVVVQEVGIYNPTNTCEPVVYVPPVSPVLY